MQNIPEYADEQGIEDIFIVDTRVFDILDSEITKYSFSHNAIEKLTLRDKMSAYSINFLIKS